MSQTLNSTPSVINEQIDYVFKQLKITGWPHAAVVTLTTYAIWQYQHNWGILLWFAVLQSSHFMRVKVLDPFWARYKAAGKDYFHVRVLLALGMLSTGCLWAAVPVFFMHDPQSETFVFVSITLAGMISATLPALAAYLPAYVLFVLPIFAALASRYYLIGMEAAAFLTMAFLGAMGGISYIINQIITRSITIDFKNQALLQEVTEAKEKAEDANQAKSRFLAAASHDLRQPLQALGLILESIRLRIGQENKTVAPLVNQCIESHDALSALLNALLELSRLESHQLEIHKMSLPLRDLVGSIVAEFQPAAQQKGLRLLCEGDDPIVHTDPVLFGRVLRNLISNAIKFTHIGVVKVSFSQQENEIVLRVADTGVGIPPTQLDKVFDEYHQVSNEARNREEGIGLGLSVVKKMCHLLKIPIELASIYNEGTTFTLHLPLGQLSNPVITQEPVQSSLEGRRVIIIDDDTSLLAAVSNIMQDWKCESLLAATLEEALDKLTNTGFVPDIILSDYRLGNGVTGIDVIKSIRAQLGKDVPAVLMSGDTDPALVKSIRDQHFYLIHKPVKPTHLRKTMRNLLGV